VILEFVGYNWESLNRHDVTPELVEEVLEGLMVSEFALDDYVDEKGESFSCEMRVGYTLGERLLEIGIRYLTVSSVFVFHAQSASPTYKAKFEEQWNHG